MASHCAGTNELAPFLSQRVDVQNPCGEINTDMTTPSNSDDIGPLEDDDRTVLHRRNVTSLPTGRPLEQTGPNSARRLGGTGGAHPSQNTTHRAPLDEQETRLYPTTASVRRTGVVDPRRPSALGPGTLLGEFEICEVIGQGGFGIVYLARDQSLGRMVAIKEYMPARLVEREANGSLLVLSGEPSEHYYSGLNGFINEARLLAQFDHPALVKVYRFWEANGTAYMAMPFYEGQTLSAALQDGASPVKEEWLLDLLDQVTRALAVLHAQKLYHRDVAPDNILILKESGRPILLDFGAARRVLSDSAMALTAILKPGYAPVEQYDDTAALSQGPWTDVYALAAVAYFAITGKRPPASVSRMVSDKMMSLQGLAPPGFRQRTLRAIDAALAVRPKDRTQDLDEFRKGLGLDAVNRDDSSGTHDAENRRVDPTRRHMTMAGIGVGLGVLVAGGLWWKQSNIEAEVADSPGVRPSRPHPPGEVSSSSPSQIPTQTSSIQSAKVAEVTKVNIGLNVRADFERIVQSLKNSRSFSVKLSRPSYRVSLDHLSIIVSPTAPGYLSATLLDPQGLVIQFLPSQNITDTFVPAGSTASFPKDSTAGFPGSTVERLEFTEPAGKATLLVVMTPERPRRPSGKPIYAWLDLTSERTSASADDVSALLEHYIGKRDCPSPSSCAADYAAVVMDFEVVPGSK